METGKLCFSVSVGVAYGTGQIVTGKGERGEISARKYYPYLDWLKAERNGCGFALVLVLYQL